MKNTALAEGDAPEPLARVVGERQIVAESDRLVANTEEEARQLRLLYGADPVKIDVVAPGADLLRYQPGDKAAARAQLGLDPRVFWEVARVSSGDSWALRTWYPVPGVVERAAANNNFEPTFSVDLARKDCGLAVQAGDVTGVHLPAARLALAQLDELIAEGYGGKDCTLVAKLASPDGTLRGFDPASDAAATAAPGPAHA